MFKKDKIYKFVYEYNDYHCTRKTLLVPAKDPASALKGFYIIVKNDVRDIIEFIEVIPKKEVENIEKS